MPDGEADEHDHSREHDCDGHEELAVHGASPCLVDHSSGCKQPTTVAVLLLFVFTSVRLLSHAYSTGPTGVTETKDIPRSRTFLSNPWSAA